MSHNPTEFTFEDIEIGLTKEFNITITQSMVNDFAKLSGDFNPLHVNEEYAKSTEFQNKVVHGMLLASFLSRMVGMYLPGKHALYASQSLEFQNPCFIGDKIIVSSIITDKSDSTKIIKIKSNIINQKNQTLLHGEGRIIIRND
tara:strand:+ start:2693 stop:3124 length:432 start_codon:yes stop_codon:yes gene_type:complete